MAIEIKVEDIARLQNAVKLMDTASDQDDMTFAIGEVEMVAQELAKKLNPEEKVYLEELKVEWAS